MAENGNQHCPLDAITLYFTNKRYPLAKRILTKRKPTSASSLAQVLG
jgi:hypothetical protein